MKNEKDILYKKFNSIMNRNIGNKNNLSFEKITIKYWN